MWGRKKHNMRQSSLIFFAWGLIFPCKDSFKLSVSNIPINPDQKAVWVYLRLQPLRPVWVSGSHPAPAPVCSATSLAAHRPNRFWWLERRCSVCLSLMTPKALSRPESIPASCFPILGEEQVRMNVTGIWKLYRCWETPKLIKPSRRQRTEEHGTPST